MNIVLIRESFEALKPHALEVVEHFYGELFTRHPQAKGLFNEAKMAKQHLALANSLAHIVEFIEDGEHLTDYLRKMGQRHVNYGTQAEHFPWVGESLLATLAYYLDAQWTPELAKSWTVAIQFIATEMKVGMETEKRKVIEMKKEESQQPTLNDFAKKIAQDLLKKAIDEEMASPNFQQALKKKSQEVLRKAIETEAMQMISNNASHPRTA